jgi:hypothetical protein
MFAVRKLGECCWYSASYNPSTGQVVKKADKNGLLPYNYVVFGVSRCDTP